jgi:hypothetical protein
MSLYNAKKEKGAEPNVHSNICLVTPEHAKSLLERNIKNRPLSKRRVRDLGNAMLKGEWRFTDESIKLDLEGRLLDGQHRLSAIVLTGIAQWTRVTRGLDTNAFEVLDRCKRRTPADVLAIHGYANYNQCASAASWLNRLTLHGGGKPDGPISSVEVLKYLELFPAIPVMVAAVKKYYVHRVFRTSGLPAAVAVMAAGPEVLEVPPRVDEFLEKLGEGIGLSRKDPIFILKRRLERGGDHITRKERAVGLIKTWNAFVEGREVSKISLVTRADGSYPDVIPLPSDG